MKIGVKKQWKFWMKFQEIAKPTNICKCQYLAKK